MRDVPASMEHVWATGQAVGDYAPVQRVMIQQARMGTRKTPMGLYRSMLGGSTATPRELPNLKSVTYTRATDQEVASVTFEFWNCEPLPPGTALGPDKDPFQRGYYNPNRGTGPYAKRWGHVTNTWQGLIRANNLIYSFEGYGADWTVGPDLDENMIPSGVWLIDKVDYASATPVISVTCRDLVGKLLADQIATPPIIPLKTRLTSLNYPVQFQARTPLPSQASVRATRVACRFDDSSNRFTAGVTNDTSEHGHYPRDGFGDNRADFWLSPGKDVAFGRHTHVWLQGRVPNVTVAEVRVTTWTHGLRDVGYQGWLSVQTADGQWHGRRVIGYVPAAGETDNGAAIRFVKAAHAEGESLVFRLDDPIENVVRVRVTLNNLWGSAWGDFRGGIRTLAVYAPAPVPKSKRLSSPVRKKGRWVSLDDNYYDYTDIVKWFACISGFHWQRMQHWTRSDGARVLQGPMYDDRYLVNGRAWGDFQETGTWGPVLLGPENFMKKPILDCIKYIADIVHFLFYADEEGGLQWKAPNIYRPGNVMPSGKWQGQRRQQYVKVADDGALLDLTMGEDSSNERDSIFVANLDGTKAAMVHGFVANDVGLSRVGGWTDQNFLSTAEARTMAELIALAEAQSLRVGKITIPGYSKIQIDDQIEITERTTGTGFLHYVRGITSKWDLTENGAKWTYELDVYWLGVQPYTNHQYTFPIEQVSPDTKEFLDQLKTMTGRKWKTVGA